MGKLIFAVVWLFVEGMGIPLLSEGAFAPLAVATGQGDISLPVAYLFAWLATCAGNAVGFFVFYRNGERLLDWLGKKWPAFQTKRVEIEPRVRAQLLMAMTVARFLGFGTFQMVLWLAGAFRTRWPNFLPYLFVLNLVWTAFWLFGSNWLAKELLPHLEGRSWEEWVAMGVLAVVVMFILHKLVSWVQTAMRQRRRGH